MKKPFSKRLCKRLLFIVDQIIGLTIIFSSNLGHLKLIKKMIKSKQFVLTVFLIFDQCAAFFSDETVQDDLKIIKLTTEVVVFAKRLKKKRKFEPVPYLEKIIDEQQPTSQK